METEESSAPDVRARIAKVACVVSVLCLLTAPIPVLTLLSSPQFASDFDGGTHEADHSGIPIAGALVICAFVAALIGAAAGRGGARTVCGLIVGAPLFCVTAMAIPRVLELLA